MEKDAKQKFRFLDLYSMVMADGIAHPEEMEALYKIGLENYGLTQEEINEEVRESGVSTPIPDTLEERISILYEMAIIAWADGSLEESEKNLLYRYARKFEVNETSIDELIDFLLDKAKIGESEDVVIGELNAD